MVTSFLSEHSAEYCLVSNLCRILEKQWTVTPVYFWSTREGSRLGRESDKGEQIKVLAMYARRPKMSQVGDEKIHVKVNLDLQKRACSLLGLGIPTIYGVPVVSSILDFHISSPCVWFNLVPSEGSYEDKYIEINKKTYSINTPNPNKSFVALKTKNIEQIPHKSRSMLLSDAINNIKKTGRGYFYSFFSYKPVFFFLKEKRG